MSRKEVSDTSGIYLPISRLAKSVARKAGRDNRTYKQDKNSHDRFRPVVERLACRSGANEAAPMCRIVSCSATFGSRGSGEHKQRFYIRPSSRAAVALYATSPDLLRIAQRNPRNVACIDSLAFVVAHISCNSRRPSPGLERTNPAFRRPTRADRLPNVDEENRLTTNVCDGDRRCCLGPVTMARHRRKQIAERRRTV